MVVVVGEERECARRAGLLGVRSVRGFECMHRHLLLLYATDQAVRCSVLRLEDSNKMQTISTD